MRPVIRALCAHALALGAFGIPLEAQRLAGSIARADGGSVEGILVQLLDSAASETRRALVGRAGSFVLEAPAPGAYTLRVARIGYRPETFGPYQLARDGLNVSLTLRSTPIQLETIHVVDDAVCAADPSGGPAAFTLWDQVRTALGAAQATSAQALEATVIGYERSLERNLRTVREQRSWLRRAVVRQPWRALPPETLHVHGYVRQAPGDSLEFHAPGLDALRSARFVEDHCFRVVRTRSRDSLGIAFQPVAAREHLPELAGVAWIDPRSFELRKLEMRYVNVPTLLSAASAGMSFARLRDGGWIISDWSIAMPQVVTYQTTVGMRERLAYVRVSGGRVISIARRGDTLWRHPPVHLSGRVVDSVSGRPVAATITVAGTDAQAETDARGAFAFHHMLPGEYAITVRTPHLDSLGIAHVTQAVVGDVAGDLVIRVPSGEQLARAICGQQSLAWRHSGTGIVIGHVRVREDSVPPTGVRVLLEWRKSPNRSRSASAAVPAGGEAGGRSGGMTLRLRPDESMQAVTDDRGMFRACGVPIGADIHVQAGLGADSASTVVTRLEGRQRLRRVEVIVNRSSLQNAAFTGRVFAASQDRAIADAEVFLPDVGEGALTDSTGTFTIARIPSGRHAVVVRRIGFLPLDTILAFVAGEITDRSIYLHSVQSLDPVQIAESALPSFAEHQRLGLGHFFTAADLAGSEGRALGDILSTIPAALVTRRQGKTTLLSARGARSLLTPDCPVQVYLDRMLMFSGREGDEPFDLNSVPLTQVAGIEFYASPAQVPRRYMGLNTHCGVLVIHTARQ